MTDHRAELSNIKRFDQLIAYLRDEMGWPITRDSFESADDLFYEFTAAELGIDPKTAAKIEEIKRLRPLSVSQPWGIFFVKFEPKRLPVAALRRILSQVALKKRASANSAERTAWAADDLLFVSNYGEGDRRQITFAHFSQPVDKHDLPTLNVLGWDNLDTPLHLEDVAEHLTHNLAWPQDETDVDAWRERWSSAFTLRHREVITTAKDLSVRLAELACAIRDRIKTALAIETEDGPLTELMKAFKEALVHDLDADGFADMYAQTIAYGLLSTRIANPTGSTADHLPLSIPVTNPFLKELMETFLHVGGRRGGAGGAGIDFDELGVSEVVRLLDDPKTHMEAVVRDFGDRNPLEDPVIHFYELFLKEYDAKKRMQRGVFYTPRPVVSYIVRSVDQLLRTEFGLEDGLADITTWGEMADRQKEITIPSGVAPGEHFVQVLDPATGTGTFLVEVIELVHTTMEEKWRRAGHDDREVGALWIKYVSEHLLPRLHGYELLMAPYAIAHLKIGLKLHETGYDFGTKERARVYLTNTLERGSEHSGQLELLLPALAHEARAVASVKASQRFTVVIGNPPYSNKSWNDTPYSNDLMRVFREPVRDEKNIQLLSDDYVRFLSFAHSMIRDRSGVGVIGMVTKHTYLNVSAFRGLREVLVNDYDDVCVFDLHGKLNEQSPPGVSDKSVFPIRVGTAILLASRTTARDTPLEETRFAELWGSSEDKLAYLGTHSFEGTPWQQNLLVRPYLFLEPKDLPVDSSYLMWTSLDDIFEKKNSGVTTSRDHLVIGTTREELRQRITRLLSSPAGIESIREEYRLTDTSNFKLESVLRRKWTFDDFDVFRYFFKPLDLRFLWYASPFLDRDRSDLFGPFVAGRNLGIAVKKRHGDTSYRHVLASSSYIDKNALGGQTYFFPLYLYVDNAQGVVSGDDQPRRVSNIATEFGERLLEKCDYQELQVADEAAFDEKIFYYVYAILYSPSYRAMYSEFLKIDFPRIPPPRDAEAFLALSELGERLVALHVMETSEQLVDTTSRYAGPAAPTVGSIQWSDEVIWLDAPTSDTERSARVEGGRFRDVPSAVWEFHIGSYQVCLAWLKERKGRALSDDEIAHYQEILAALTETIRLMGEIDRVIDHHGGWPDAFMTSAN